MSSISPTPDAPEADRAATIALCVALLGAVLLCALVPLLPAHDGPQHLLMGRIEGHFGDRAQGYDRFFIEAPQFAGRGFAFWFVPLERLVGAYRAAFVAPVVVLVVSALGSAAFVRLVDRRRAWLALVCVPLAFSWPFYMGFYPFVVSTAGGLAALGALCRALDGGALEDPRRRRALAVGFFAAFAALSVMHSVAALLCAAPFALVALWCAVDTKRRSARAFGLRLAWVAGVLSPVAVLVALTLRTHAQAVTGLAGRVIWQGSAAQRLGSVGALFAPGPRPRGAAVLAVAVLAAAYALARWRDRRPVERALALAATTFALGAWLVPTHLPGWDFVSPRLVPLAVLCGVALVPVERSRLGPALCALAACALAVWPVRFQLETRARLADAWSGLGRGAVRSGPRLSVLYEPFAGLESDPWRRDVIEWHPLRTVALLYGAVEGGVNHLMFRGHAGVHAQLDAIGSEHRWPPLANRRALDAAGRAAGPGLRDDALADVYAAAGARYTDVILLGPPAARARFALRGYAREYQSGRLSIERFVGCSARVVVSGPGAAQVRALRMGHSASSDASDALLLSEPDATGARSISLARALCGPAWVRPEGALRCAGADASGRLALSVSPGAELRCALAQP